MSYTTLRQQLLKVFNDMNFRQLWENGQREKYRNNGRNPNTNILNYQVPNQYNFNLTVNFPGYKTEINRYGNFVYDYRVSLNNIPISHVNIIVDLYNKAKQAPEIINLLSNYLISIAQAGDELNLANFNNIHDMIFNVPNQNLLQYVAQIHNDMNKNYLYRGNLNWNYTLEELSILIPLIVLQEDINYPMPRFEGRRMSFYRYLEALYCAGNNAQHNLGEVIKRALSHRRPTLWNDCINYQPIVGLG